MKQKLTGLKVSDLKVGDVVGPFSIRECASAAVRNIHVSELIDDDGSWFAPETTQELIDAFGVEREVELETVASGVVKFAIGIGPHIGEVSADAWLVQHAQFGDTIEVRRAK